MLNFKDGVSLCFLQPQIVLGLISIHSVFEAHGYDATLTSISDGIHKANSRHYVGNAVDIRIKSINSSDITRLVADVRSSLGSNFDVVLEVDHLHIEYDPKDLSIGSPRV